jgi:hypothetical protein
MSVGHDIEELRCPDAVPMSGYDRITRVSLASALFCLVS